MTESGDGTRLELRPNARIVGEPLERRRFALLTLGPLVMLLDRLRAVPTARAVATGQPFVYPLELTFYVPDSLAAGPAALVPDLPASVAAAARARRPGLPLLFGHQGM